MLGAEAEDASQPLARHTVGQGIHVNRGVAVEEEIKGGDGLLVLGVLARDGPRLDQALDGLVHLPFPRLESIVYGGVVADDEQGLVGEVVQKTGAFGVQYLHVLVQIVQLGPRGVLGAAGGGEGGQLLVQYAGGLGSAALSSLSLGADDLLQLGKPLGVGEQLTGGKQVGLVDGVGHALGFGIEQAHTVDLVTEQLHAQGVRALDQLPLVVVEGGVGGADVDDPAADGELTGALHHVHPGVSRPHQSGGQVGRLNGGVVVQMHRGGAETVGGDGVAQSRVGGGDDGIVASRDEA